MEEKQVAVNEAGVNGGCAEGNREGGSGDGVKLEVFLRCSRKCIWLCRCWRGKGLGAGFAEGGHLVDEGGPVSGDALGWGVEGIEKIRRWAICHRGLG